MMPFYILPPLPPRELFPSDESYEEAKGCYEEARRRQAEMIKDEEAALILMAIICVGLMVIMIGSVSVFAFGWRGPFYLAAAGVLLWTAYRQIRVRL